MGESWDQNMIAQILSGEHHCMDGLRPLLHWDQQVNIDNTHIFVKDNISSFTTTTSTIIIIWYNFAGKEDLWREVHGWAGCLVTHKMCLGHLGHHHHHQDHHHHHHHCHHNYCFLSSGELRTQQRCSTNWRMSFKQEFCTFCCPQIRGLLWVSGMVPWSSK